MLFFGPLCYSPMLQTMSDYALEISRLLFFIKINFTKQVTQYHSFSRISLLIIINNVSAYYILQHQRIFYVVLERIVLLLPNIYRISSNSSHPPNRPRPQIDHA